MLGKGKGSPTNTVNPTEEYLVYSISPGIDFRRQNLTSKDDPRTERIKIFLMNVNH